MTSAAGFLCNPLRLARQDLIQGFKFREGNGSGRAMAGRKIETFPISYRLLAQYKVAWFTLPQGLVYMRQQPFNPLATGAEPCFDR